MQYLMDMANVPFPHIVFDLYFIGIVKVELMEAGFKVAFKVKEMFSGFTEL